LISKGIAVDHQDSDGLTPLHYELKARPGYNRVQILLNGGADVNRLTPDKYTPLMLAVENTNDAAIINNLINYGAEVEPENTYRGKTPLMLAAANTSNENIIDILLSEGAEVGRRDAEGRRVVDYLDRNQALFGTDAYWDLQYLEPEKRKLDTLDLKSQAGAATRGLIIPSLGHAYAESWWPKGALFLAGEAVMLGMAVTRDDFSEATPYLIGFSALKAFEIFDVLNEVGKFNEDAEEYNQQVEEFNLRLE